MRALSFAAVGGEAGMRFGERRFARGVAVDLALRAGVLFARDVNLAAGSPQGSRAAVSAADAAFNSASAASSA